MAGFDPVFGASGTSHVGGSVPDPGSVAGISRYLREDATWNVPTPVPPAPTPPAPGPGLDQWACDVAGFLVYSFTRRAVKTMVDGVGLPLIGDAIGIVVQGLLDLFVPELVALDPALSIALADLVSTFVTGHITDFLTFLADDVFWAKIHCFVYDQVVANPSALATALAAAATVLMGSALAPAAVLDGIALVLQNLGVSSFLDIPLTAVEHHYDCSTCASTGIGPAIALTQTNPQLAVTDGTTRVDFVDTIQVNHTDVAGSGTTATLTPKVGLEHNATGVGVEPNIDFVDSLTVSWVLTDDPSGHVTHVSALGASGSITSVTASPPLASSGGTTPNLSLSGIVDAAHGGLGIDTSAFVKGTILANTGSAWEGDAPASNGLVLTADSAQPGGVSWASPGSVSAAGPWYTVVSPPSLSNWTQVNAGAASFADVTGGVAIDTVAEAQNMRILIRSKSAPYDIVAAFVGLLIGGTSNPAFGLVIRDSVSGKLERFALYDNAGASLNTQVGTFSAPNVGVANPYLSTTALGVITLCSPPVWMRIHNDGTHRTFHVSRDGARWVQLFSENSGTYLTENQVGFFADSGGSGFPAGVTLFSWSGA